MNTKIKNNAVALSLMLFSIFSINHCYAVTVGDSYGGGTVFCVSYTADTTKCRTEGSGDYGLIMANEDQANFDSHPKDGGVRWHNSPYSGGYAGALSEDDGANNTAGIISANYDHDQTNTAAWVCHNYKDPIEGHTDWYLPSKNELNKMYLYAKAHNLIGRGCSGVKPCFVENNGYYMRYWSSSTYSGRRYDYDSAWAQDFSFGDQLYSNQLVSDKFKSHFRVRAIRAFNNSTIIPLNKLTLNSNQNQLIQEKAENDLHIKPVDFSSRVSVGDSYGGGTVFCVSDTEDTTQCRTKGSGNYGLIMANEDQANFDSNPKHGVTWASSYKEIPGAESLDNGAANTAAIIAAHPQENPSNNAAWLSHNYKDPIEGHTDWYLPSKNELNKMYVYAKEHDLIGKGCSGSKANGVQCLLGGYDNYMLYWSSSSDRNSYAWHQYFSNGRQYPGYKFDYYYGARAIRAFKHLPIQPQVGVPSLAQSNAQSSRSEISSTNMPGGLSAIPEVFICPITQETMVDPVIAADGHTYERTAIEGWFVTGKRTSPMTNLQLDHTTLIPNIALRQTIEIFMNTMPH